MLITILKSVGLLACGKSLNYHRNYKEKYGFFSVSDLFSTAVAMAATENSHTTHE